MTNIEKMLAHNRGFVENNLAESYRTTKYPPKKITILSCMDTRLTKLLPARSSSSGMPALSSAICYRKICPKTT